MFLKYIHCQNKLSFVLLGIFALGPLFMGSNVCAEPEVKLVTIPPNLQTLSIGANLRKIAIQTQTNQPGLKFLWELDGPGVFAGEDATNPGVVYVLPDSINSSSIDVTVTVHVSSKQGENTSVSVIFTLTGPEPDPTPYPTATPTPYPTPQPTQTPTPIPTPVPTLSPLERQVEIADGYFKKQKFTTPKGENAFDMYKDVLKKDPANRHIKDQICEIAKIYKRWGDKAYKRKNFSKAEAYYQRHLYVAEYIVDTFGDWEVQQESPKIRKRLNSMTTTPTPRPTASPTPRRVKATPTPKIEFKITGIILRDAKNKIIRSGSDGVYSVKRNESIKVTVDFTNPHKHETGIAWTAGQGKVLPIASKANTYIGTKLGGDYLVIIVWDKKTGEELKKAVTLNVVR